MNLQQLLSTITSNATSITLFLGFIGGVIKFWQWISIKQADEKKRKFETYHNLIADLVESRDINKTIKLDRQIAIVYELRNFYDYFFVTKRILIGLKNTWLNKGPDRLITEINLTLDYINGNWLTRKFIK